MVDTEVTFHRSAEPSGVKTPRKAAIAGWIGSALEYYDFFIYGTAAALVFPAIFFPKANPAAGTLLSLATFGVGYLARPVGAFFMGHFGDKFGRKKVMIFTLTLMGVSTFLVGCLPTYHQVGLWAPALLVVLRLLQGLSASGEQPSANSMTLEHAPANQRGFYTSFVLSGTQAGQVISTAVFLPLAAILPNQELLTWGWRIPFVLSAVLVVVGYLIRRTLDETPAFQEEVAHEDVAKLPLAILLRDNWADVLRVIFVSLVGMLGTIFGIWALSFATHTMKISATPMLWVSVLTNIAALTTIPLWARLSDRIGRKPVFIASALGSAIMVFAYLWAISTASLPLIFVVGILFAGVIGSAAGGLQPVIYGEMFPTKVRLSGMAIGSQLGLVLAGFSPTIAAAIAGPGRNGWPPVAIFAAGALVLAAIAVATGRETYRVPMHELGTKPAKTTRIAKISVNA